MIADGRLEPGPGPSRLVEHRGVGDLELGDGEPPVEAGPAVVEGEGVGRLRHHPPQQVPYVTGAEPGTDAMGLGGVGDRAQPVVQGLEAHARLGQLAFGPFMPVGTRPQGIRRVAADLEEGRAPVGIPEVQVPVVGNRRHPPPCEVGVVGTMTGVRLVDETPPRRGPLLGLAHQHQPGSACRGGLLLVRAGDVLLALVALEAHHGHVVGNHQVVELGHQPVVVVGEPRRGRDAIAPLQQEPKHATLVLQPGDVAPDADAVHRGAAEADVLGQ